MPSYLCAELGSRDVFTGSSTNGSRGSHRPFPLVSVNIPPHTPLGLIGPSQAGFGPHGVSLIAATPTLSAAGAEVEGVPNGESESPHAAKSPPRTATASATRAYFMELPAASVTFPEMAALRP